MTIAKSEFATTELANLQTANPEVKVALSFTEPQSLSVAAWAAKRFAPTVLVERVIDRYNEDPVRDSSNHEVDIFESGSLKWQYELDEAEALGVDVAHDLSAAAKRLERGYAIGSVVMHGALDATAVIGSLKRAAEMHPDNLYEGEQYLQAAAGYILDHMQVIDADIGRTTSYLL